MMKYKLIEPNDNQTWYFTQSKLRDLIQHIPPFERDRYVIEGYEKNGLIFKINAADWTDASFCGLNWFRGDGVSL